MPASPSGRPGWPAIILWRSPSNDVFVIDGSHRLSSLIAWVQDDYGDGTNSREFFEHSIPKAQLDAAEKTRKIINKEVGSYADLKFAISNPQKPVKPEHVDRAKRLGSLAINVQWVNGDATKAEKSFFKINQQGTVIDPTELSMLKRGYPQMLWLPVQLFALGLGTNIGLSLLPTPKLRSRRRLRTYTTICSALNCKRRSRLLIFQSQVAPTQRNPSPILPTLEHAGDAPIRGIGRCWQGWWVFRGVGKNRFNARTLTSLQGLMFEQVSYSTENVLDRRAHCL